MRYLGRITTPVESLVHRFRQHHGTVASPRASKCYRQVALSLADIVRDQIDQQSFHAPQEFPGLRKRTDIARDARIASGKFAQLGNKMRIWQKAHVEDQIGVGWNSKLIAKTYQANHHRVAVSLLHTTG